MTYKYVGRFAEADDAYGERGRSSRRCQGTDPEDLAALFHNLGGLAHARGDFEAAEPLARRAIEIRSQALGERALRRCSIEALTPQSSSGLAVSTKPKPQFVISWAISRRRWDESPRGGCRPEQPGRDPSGPRRADRGGNPLPAGDRNQGVAARRGRTVARRATEQPRDRPRAAGTGGRRRRALRPGGPAPRVVRRRRASQPGRGRSERRATRHGPRRGTSW